MIKPRKLWAISGFENEKRIILTGTWRTKREAIVGHLTERLVQYGSWSACRAVGDRAIKVLVTPEFKHARRTGRPRTGA